MSWYLWCKLDCSRPPRNPRTVRYGRRGYKGTFRRHYNSRIRSRDPNHKVLLPPRSCKCQPRCNRRNSSPIRSMSPHRGHNRRKFWKRTREQGHNSRLQCCIGCQAGSNIGRFRKRRRHRKVSCQAQTSSSLNLLHWDRKASSRCRRPSVGEHEQFHLSGSQWCMFRSRNRQPASRACRRALRSRSTCGRC